MPSPFGHPLAPEDSQRLDDLYDRFQKLQGTLVGYPCNQLHDYSELNRFLAFTINNVGDPFSDSYFLQNTHEFEREVLAFFAQSMRAPEGEYWGYVNNGGTEGNMYGLYLARELMPEGMVYFSEDTHYSVTKILRVLHTRNIMIKSQDNGEIDYDDLQETLRIHRDVPPVIFANIGTTMKGACDNITRIRQILDKLAIHTHYIHCDAALSGMILPFVDQPTPFDFADGADSLSISGHKLIGSPLPCGVVLARKKHVDRIARSIEYIGALDTTLTGSRNAFTPLILWYAIKVLGREGLKKIVDASLDLADYAIRKFAEHDIHAWRNLNSITVVFPRPSLQLIRKWQIAPYRNIGHLITLPHVTRPTIDKLVAEIAEQAASKSTH